MCNGLAALSLLSYVSKACRPRLLSTARHFDFDFESLNVQSIYNCCMEFRKHSLDQMYSLFQVKHHVKIGSKGTEMSQMRLEFMAVEACESNSQLYNDISLYRFIVHVIYVKK